MKQMERIRSCFGRVHFFGLEQLQAWGLSLMKYGSGIAGGARASLLILAMPPKFFGREAPKSPVVFVTEADPLL